MSSASFRARCLLGSIVGFATLVTFAAPGAAASWRYAGGEAGLWVDGDFNGITLSCRNGELAMSVFGFPERLEAGLGYTVVLDVDGTARRLRTRPGTRRGAPGSVLSVTLAGAEAKNIVDAIRRGRKAEISTPAGRYGLPLSGSAKALDRLIEACPGLG
ncbi:hypothetical protein LQ948_03125 [Jiella sp. MQZ9-1]|uniref:Invasion associated locus B (IalB) protein n=1 Tax=Jiella flava TaxID=2816857 RepID=A0A939FWX7_9HYPH|nr:hypothetical protein [Jiella flava]MBO0661558.1 hypothetical protein [Jiella flava]MCD2470200.1 hypothetical protein [Jiella flava]